jgi:hypothetical protein
LLFCVIVRTLRYIKTTTVMENSLVRITAQYYENYGSAEAPHWKPKGGQEFSLRADSDSFFYCEEECVKAIKKLLVVRSSDYVRYEYLEHELVFEEPRELSSEAFEVALQEVYQEYEDMAHKAAAFLEN